MSIGLGVPRRTVDLARPSAARQRRAQPHHRRGPRIGDSPGSAPGHARAGRESRRCRSRPDRAAGRPLAGPIIRRPAPGPRGVDEITGEHQPETRPRTGPCLRLALGSDGPPALGPLAKSSGMSGIDGTNGLAIRMIPFQTAWGFRKGSRQGERPIQDGRPGVSSTGESRSSSGAILPRAVRDGRPAPHLARHRGSSISKSTPRSNNPSGTSTMSFDPHSRRFNPRWLFPAIETNGEETSARRTRLPSPRTRSRRTTRPAGISMRHSSRSRRKGAVCVLSAGRSWRAMDPW